MGVIGLVVAMPGYYLSQWNYESSTAPRNWTWPWIGSWYRGSRFSSPITMKQALDIAESHLASLNNPDLAIHEIMEFEYNFYVIYYEKSTGIGAFEMLIDKPNAPRGGMMGGGMMGGGMMTGVIRPEPGPNMMWNTKYGMMQGMMGTGRQVNAPIEMQGTEQDARSIAENYLSEAFPGAHVEGVTRFYGYYTIDFEQNDKVIGMLSVNGYTGQVWYHSWHGAFIQEEEFD